MIELKIDPEFRDKIPPLTDSEYEQLRENILEAGEIYEPIVTWNGAIVDGHNRYKIIRENPKIKWRTREMKFADKWEAFEWMYKNQLGRRNLTDEQRTYMIGKMYEARKNTEAFKGNQHTLDGCAQNGHNHKCGRTAETIAAEIGVGKETVKRAGQFSQGVDTLKKFSPKAADKVLRGESPVTKAAIRSIRNLDADSQERAAKAIEIGAPIKDEHRQEDGQPPKKKNSGRSAEIRRSYKIIDAAYRPMIDPSAQERFTVDDLVEEIKANGTDFSNLLRRTIAERSELLNDGDARGIVRKAVDEIVNAIMNVRNMI